MNITVAATDVTKSYPVGDTTVDVLNGVSLRVHKGKTCALMGPSGSGKSTFLAIVGSLERASSGEIEIEGTRLGSLSERQRARFRSERIGFVFQNYNLIPHLNALQNVRLAMEFGPRKARARTTRAAAQALLEHVGLQHRAFSPVSLLSGGEQQRVAVARALANSPVLVLADEPTGNLDSASGQLVMQALLRVPKAGGTLLLVTHDADIAAQADEVVHLRDGRVDRSEPVSFESGVVAAAYRSDE